MNDAATSARFNNPYGVACDGTNVWITDQGNNNIRRMTVVDRVVSTVTGTCTAGTGIAYGGPRGTNNGVVVYAACQLATNQYKIVKYDLDGSAELADFAFYTGVAATPTYATDYAGGGAATAVPLTAGAIYRRY